MCNNYEAGQRMKIVTNVTGTITQRNITRSLRGI
jgi:hypothetical protein